MVVVEGVLLAWPDVMIPQLTIQAGPSMNISLLPEKPPKLVTRTCIPSPKIAPVIALAPLLRKKLMTKDSDTSIAQRAGTSRETFVPRWSRT